jgi:hypothetical protein
MNNNNDNNLYMHRIIKIISPITCQTFKIELNGKEDEMRELLGTILEISPKSIKGLRDSFNNYYTLSSALKNPLINSDPYNYYTVVIKGYGISNDIKYIKYPSLNLSKNQKLPYETINYENKTNFLGEHDNYYNNRGRKFNTKEFLKIVDELYKREYLDKNLKKKLKKLIKEDNPEILSILNNYINSEKNYDELAKKIKPVISSSSSSYSHSNSSKKSNRKSSSQSSHHSKNNKKKNLKRNESNSNKKENLTKEERILKDIKVNFKKEQYSKLKLLLKRKNNDIIKFIKKFQKDHDYNHLISKLMRLLETYKDDKSSSENSKSKSSSKKDSEDSDGDNSMRKKDSSDFIKGEKSSKKVKKEQKIDEDDIKKISKKIFNSLKKKRKDIYYIAKYDFEKLKLKEKINLFKQIFLLNLEKIIRDNSAKIPKKNLALIEKYYMQYMENNILKDLNEDQRSLYEQICDDAEENKIIAEIYQDFLENKNINELQNQIKSEIEKYEKLDFEEDEHEIKEENSQDEEDEEEEYEEEEEEESQGEGEGEDEGQENENEKDKESSSDNFILNKDDKDETIKLLNTNYRKNNHLSNFAPYNKNKSNEDKGENEEKKNDEKEDNLGLDFVLVKQKKPVKEEEKKDDDFNYNNNLNNKDKENSVSTNNQNKKIALFISQIEHIKKVEEIKKLLIEAIHNNNKYMMELFQKFQKNKFILNKKSLYDVYNKIKENPESNNNNNTPGLDKNVISNFKSLLNNISKFSEKEKEFFYYDLTTNKNSKFFSAISEYEMDKDKEEFIENIEIIMKPKSIRELFVQFCVKKIKESGKENILEDSKEIIKIIQEKELFDKKDCDIMMQYLEHDDGVFLGIFRELFSSGNYNEFVENMNIALANKNKGGRNNENKLSDKSRIDNEAISKNFKEVRDNIEEKYYNSLDELYKKKDENLIEILKNINSSNLDKKIETITVLILKKELSPK